MGDEGLRVEGTSVNVWGLMPLKGDPGGPGRADGAQWRIPFKISAAVGARRLSISPVAGWAGQRLGFHTHVLDYFWTSVTAGHGRGRVASVADPAIFKSGRDLAAWIGLVPRQNSSGGKERLGGITKTGNGYLRQMLMVGAMAVIRYAQRNSARLPWLVQLHGSPPDEGRGYRTRQKTARTVWALMSSGERYRDPQAMQATVSTAA